ncbi:RNA polymerase subunit sigma-70 [Prauserella marina]|uniref:RNA polymerase sigma-70 factor, ECF subfamily n=1 Tax=Prauserella marina TaxID=530584 RepID=A0A222VNJ5_9PSEU|nr:sigma-70 family RNA polymerase sigma factor [Prauserella marina]ASR35506.1 RNA polymerase subunit sigma-70 [Prauserella marina]PWV84668.1 RNA polymerase sigma-70 factor (ECF subfamily) [Prauserella marina]SDC16214.1 RNA polymerase sigma-70 factor, ECF subfamily [Prauserella marina]
MNDTRAPGNTGEGRDPDIAVLARAARGEAAAFDRLVRKHTPRMYRVALRLTGSAAEAEDVVQEAWLSAWRAMPGFRGEAAVSTWLYRVVTNTALASLRRRAPTVSLDAAIGHGAGGDEGGGTLFGMGALSDPHANPEGKVVRAEQVGAVLHAIGQLELSQRVPLVLKELEALSYEEVAQVLAVSVPALRARLHRARVALLAKLGTRP